MKFPLMRKKSDSAKEVPLEQTKFISLLTLSINQKFAEVLAAKATLGGTDNSSGSSNKKRSTSESDPAMITLLDATTITNYVRSVFVKKLTFVPPPVEAALTLSEATVAPSTIQKLKMFKRAAGLVGGLTGLGTIAMAIIIGLGVGSAATAPAIWASILTWLGVSSGSAVNPLLLPVAIGLGGAGIAAFSVYFSASGSSAERAEKFRKALLNSCEKAVETIWEEYGERLSK